MPDPTLLQRPLLEIFRKKRIFEQPCASFHGEVVVFNWAFSGMHTMALLRLATLANGTPSEMLNTSFLMFVSFFVWKKIMKRPQPHQQTTPLALQYCYSIFGACSTHFLHLNFLFNSVAVFFLTELFSVPAVICLMSLHDRRPMKLGEALFCICLGFSCIAAFLSSQITLLGAMAALFHVLSTALQQMAIHLAHREVHRSGISVCGSVTSLEMHMESLPVQGVLLLGISLVVPWLKLLSSIPMDNIPLSLWNLFNGCQPVMMEQLFHLFGGVSRTGTAALVTVAFNSAWLYFTILILLGICIPAIYAWHFDNGCLSFLVADSGEGSQESGGDSHDCNSDVILVWTVMIASRFIFVVCLSSLGLLALLNPSRSPLESRFTVELMLSGCAAAFGYTLYFVEHEDDRHGHENGVQP